VDALAELPSRLKQLGGAPLTALAARRRESGLQSEAASDAVRLASLEGEKEVASLEIGRPDRVDEAEPHAHRPASIDARQVPRRDLGCWPFAKP
jgi:hypothetical protein